MKERKTTYQEVPVKEVMAYFVKGFTPPTPEEEIIGADFFLDTAKGIVVFKLTSEVKTTYERFE